MTFKNKTAVVFGGTGFIGRQVVRELADAGAMVKVATRIPESAYFLRPCGTVGQVVPFACDYSDDKSIRQAVKGCDFAVNCIGLLYEKKKGGFARAHVEVPRVIAKACKQENVERFVHISALGIQGSKSQYAATKCDGEKAVFKAFKDGTVILRPSIVFGPEDNFFNQFAEMSRYLPFLPLIGGGHTKFQPVYVGDVADAVMAGLSKRDAAGHIYELGGPEVLNFRDVYETIFHYTGRKRPLVKLPWRVAKLQAMFLSLLPKPLLTRDQVESLKTDSVVHSGKGVLTLHDLGVAPTMLHPVLTTYLPAYRSGGKFSHKPVL